MFTSSCRASRADRNSFAFTLGLILAFVLYWALSLVSMAFAADGPNIRQDAAIILMGDSKQGSGYVTAPHIIVTAKHVAEVVSRASRDGKTWKPATILWVHPVADIAVMYAPAIECPCVETAAMRAGTDAEKIALTIVGYPKYTIQHEQVTVTGKWQGSLSGFYLVAAPVNAGMSGGPIYADTPDGVLAVGVVYGIPADADGHLMVDVSMYSPIDTMTLKVLIAISEAGLDEAPKTVNF